jgi:hypothetical protein
MEISPKESSGKPTEHIAGSPSNTAINTPSENISSVTGTLGKETTSKIGKEASLSGSLHNSESTSCGLDDLSSTIAERAGENLKNVVSGKAEISPSIEQKALISKSSFNGVVERLNAFEQELIEPGNVEVYLQNAEIIENDDHLIFLASAEVPAGTSPGDAISAWKEKFQPLSSLLASHFGDADKSIETLIPFGFRIDHSAKNEGNLSISLVGQARYTRAESPEEDSSTIECQFPRVSIPSDTVLHTFGRHGLAIIDDQLGTSIETAKYVVNGDSIIDNHGANVRAFTEQTGGPLNFNLLGDNNLMPYSTSRRIEDKAKSSLQAQIDTTDAYPQGFSLKGQRVIDYSACMSIADWSSTPTPPTWRIVPDHQKNPDIQPESIYSSVTTNESPFLTVKENVGTSAETITPDSASNLNQLLYLTFDMAEANLPHLKQFENGDNAQATLKEIDVGLRCWNQAISDIKEVLSSGDNPQVSKWWGEDGGKSQFGSTQKKIENCIKLLEKNGFKQKASFELNTIA